LSIGNTSDANTFEFTAIKLFYCSLEIRSSLELNKAPFTITVSTSLGVNNVKTGLTSEIFEILPTGLSWKASDLHTVRRTSRTGSSALSSSKRITVASPASELHGQTFAHKVGTMESRNDVASIHSILVFDKTEAIHKLDLGDLACAMSIEVGFNIRFGRITRQVAQVQSS